MHRRAVAVCIVFNTTIAACLVSTMLSSTQQQQVVVSPLSFTFPDTQVTTSSSTQISIVPASGSSQTDDINTITSINAPCSDFTVTPMAPLPNDVSRRCGSGSGTGTAAVAGGDVNMTTCTSTSALYTATFTPTAAGSASCTVTFDGSGATFTRQTVQLFGNGTLQPFAIDLSPAVLDFGDVRVGGTPGLSHVTITNTGSMPLDIMKAQIAPAGIFAITPAPPADHLLPAGKSEQIDITCTPSSVIGFMATLTVSSNATNAPNATTTLKCRGTDSLLIETPSPVAFSTRVGEPTQKIVQIQNSGSAAAQIDQYSITGTDLTVVGTPTMVGPGSSTTVMVKYAATTAHANGPLGSLTINHDGGKNDTVAVNGEALATTLSVNPDGNDFKTVCAGTTAVIDVNVFANGAGKFDIVGATAPAAPFTFALKTGTFPQTALGTHGNDITFTATAKPLAPGKFHGVATVKTNIPPGNASRDIGFDIEALAAGVGATPARVDFGTQNGLAVTTAQTVQLTNCSGNPLMVTSAAIGGLDQGDFAIVSPNPVARTLAPGERMEFLVVMSPRTNGVKTAELDVLHALGTSTVALDGTALGGGDGNGSGRETYYNCSAGGGMAGALVIVVVVIGLVIGTARRRRP